jgi:25S rRNA (adenine2142-N1)-methyltransferase
MPSRPRPIVPVPQRVTSRRHARKLTTAYHDITHRLAAAKSDAELAACKAELAQMGGVEAYQAASALNTRLNSTSRWVQRSLRRSAPVGSSSPIRVLEIGAVNTQLLEAEGFAVRAIDLHASDPRIEQCDFLSLPHGGELDAATGVTRPYDAVVCSMVLNCVPHERRRFDMLVGIRAHLRVGGRAFITLPRSCLDHSFTLCEASFVDALAAVGLRCNTEGESTNPPESAKIVYFECTAGMPCPEAALSVQRARHEARRAHRASARAKSAGASFDVDVGGCLGFGVRVPRSYVPPEGPGRAAKEQALCREEFLRQCQEQDLKKGIEAKVAAPPAGGHGAVGAAAEEATRAEMCEPADGDGEADEAGTIGNGWDADARAGVTGASEASLAIAGQLERVAREDAAHLDYCRWRWYETGSPSRAAAGEHWRLVPSETPQSADDGSSQARSGWHWTRGGWVQQNPSSAASMGLEVHRTATVASGVKLSSGAPSAGGVATRGIRRPQRNIRTSSRRHLKARLWNLGPDCWWRSVTLPLR